MAWCSGIAEAMTLERDTHSVLQRHLLPLALLLGVVTQTNKAEPMPETVRVMSFNLWHGGDAGKQPLERTVEVIKQSQADIVGLQETAGIAPEGEPRPDRAAEIAKRLGWNYVDQGERTGVISRFEIVGTTPRKWGVKLALPSGRQVYLFNVHFAHAPYQPYQLLDIPYENAPFLKTAEEAVAAAQAARGEQVQPVFGGSELGGGGRLADVPYRRFQRAIAPRLDHGRGSSEALPVVRRVAFD